MSGGSQEAVPLRRDDFRRGPIRETNQERETGNMEGMGWILSIVLGAIAGWIAENIMKFDTGLLMNIVLGIVGAMVGNFLLSLVGVGLTGIVGQLVVAVLGACILIYVYRMLKAR